MFDAVSAGVPASQALDFLRENAILAKAGVTELKFAVDGVTSVLNAFHIQVKDTNKVTAAFFTAQKYGKTTVEELTKKIGSSAPTARAAGLSFQELLATYAELTKQGIDTAESTTAIKATIKALIKPAEGAAEVFSDLNIQVGLRAVREQGLFNVIHKIN